MRINLNIKNFGKIKDADLEISPFTVLTGKNSSGKSFITKGIYSFFNSINSDHLSLASLEATELLNTCLNLISLNLARKNAVEIELLNNLSIHQNKFKDVIENKLRRETFLKQSYALLEMKDIFHIIQKTFIDLRTEVKGKKKFLDILDYCDIYDIQLTALRRILAEPNVFLTEKIRDYFSNELKENFQVSSLSELKNYNSSTEEKIVFSFSESINLQINKNSISMELPNGEIDKFQSLYNVVFLESPLYWQLQNPLDSLRKESKFRRTFLKSNNDGLFGVPKYFYDLLDLLLTKEKFSDEPEFDFNEQIEEIIGGAIVKDNDGNVKFKENTSNRLISLHRTASGIKNLGIIALLIKNKIICKGSVLFIDEPEVNLHPEWQVAFIKILFKMSEIGINIVLATHSSDVLKCIEVIIEDNIRLAKQGHFSLNQLDSNGCSINRNEPILQKINLMKQDLSDPFVKLFTEGL